MLFRKLNWNIVGWFKTVSTISYIVIALGLGAMIYHATTAPGAGFQPSHALRLGLSFTGGTDITAAFVKPVTTDQVKAALAPLDLNEAKVNTLGTAGTQVSIETQTSFADNSKTLWDALAKAAPVDRANSKIESVSPSLGGEYLRNALWALVIALGIQFLYIAFRFGWNYIFGLVTVIALVRDAAMMIGIYALAGQRADDAFLAAVLTVIGYSVMDTIVILDRIRENTKLMVGQPYDTIVNESIKQTMTRSFNTLATVIITLVALLALGGASLKNFAFALLVGICSGGYHSIFYSAPLVASFQKRMGARAKLRRASALEAPARTVAEARAQARSDADRAEILALRKARRERERQSSRRAPDGPPKYKRRRIETTNDTAMFETETTHDHDHRFDDEEYDVADLERETREADGLIDPLDAQSLGHHERDYDLGHEEIHLNLDAADEPAHSETGEAHPPARETPHSS